MRRALLLSSSLLAACLLAAPELARAQETAGDFFREEYQRQQRAKQLQQRPTRLIRRAAPVRGFTVDTPEGEKPASDAPTLAAPAPAQEPASPAPAAETGERFTVAIIGDNMSSMLAQGLSDTFADRRDINLIRRSRDGSGLVRNDWFDWMKGAQDLLASGEKLNAVVLMIGSNDRPMAPLMLSLSLHAGKSFMRNASKPSPPSSRSAKYR